MKFGVDQTDDSFPPVNYKSSLLNESDSEFNKVNKW